MQCYFTYFKDENFTALKVIFFIYNIEVKNSINLIMLDLRIL